MAEELAWLDAVNAGAAFNDPQSAMKIYSKVQDAARELSSGRDVQPQSASGVPTEQEVMESLRAACVDAPRNSPFPAPSS